MDVTSLRLTSQYKNEQRSSALCPPGNRYEGVRCGIKGCDECRVGPLLSLCGELSESVESCFG